MLRGIVVVLLLVCSGSVAAQQVHKCVNGKQVSYQSEPCPGQVQKTWDATPQSVDPYLERRLDLMRQEQAQRNAAPVRQQFRSTGRSIPLGQDQSACERAKAERKAAYDRVGVNRTFALSSHWDGIVQKACM